MINSCFLYSRNAELAGFGRLEGFVLIADAVNCLEVIERHALAFEEVAYLYDVLVERAASDICMNTPDRVDEILPSDDRGWVVLKISEDADFLAANCDDFSIGKGNFHCVRIYGCRVEGKRSVGEFYVFGYVEVASDFCSTKDCMNSGDQFRGAERFCDVVVSSKFESLYL